MAISRDVAQEISRIMRNQITEIITYQETPEEARAILVALPGNTSVTDLCLVNMDDAATAELAALLKTNTPLKSITLKDGAITTASLSLLTQTLKTNTSLSFFGTDSLHIGDGGAELMADVIRHNQHLESMMICHAGINDGGGLKLISALKDNFTLNRLALHGNHIPELMEEKIKELITTRQFRGHLRERAIRSSSTLQRPVRAPAPFTIGRKP